MSGCFSAVIITDLYKYCHPNSQHVCKSSVDYTFCISGQKPLYFIFSNVPSKITRIDIGSEPLLIAMELLSYEVHFSCQYGLVTFFTKIVSIRRDIAA